MQRREALRLGVVFLPLHLFGIGNQNDTLFFEKISKNFLDFGFSPLNAKKPPASQNGKQTAKYIYIIGKRTIGE